MVILQAECLSPHKYVCMAKRLNFSSNSCSGILAVLLRSQTTAGPTGAFGRSVLWQPCGPRRMGMLEETGREKRKGWVCLCMPGFQSSMESTRDCSGPGSSKVLIHVCLGITSITLDID